MSDSTDRYGTEPLGKSVEEVEGEQGNRVNSPVPGEQVRHDEQTVAVVPAVSNANMAAEPAVIDPEVSPPMLRTDQSADER